LPETKARLPAQLQKRRLPSQLLARLNHHKDSPLFEKIQTRTNPDGPIKDNSFLKMLEQSLSDGALYRFTGESRGLDDIDGMVKLLSDYWHAVGDVFPTDWVLPPKKSRLLHGAGIIALGLLMDAICDRWKTGMPIEEEFADELKKIAPLCHWSEGTWTLGLPEQERRWCDIQNTSKDIALLSGYLVAQYRKMEEK
jgi:hypothetical protein